MRLKLCVYLIVFLRKQKVQLFTDDLSLLPGNSYGVTHILLCVGGEKKVFSFLKKDETLRQPRHP